MWRLFDFVLGFIVHAICYDILFSSGFRKVDNMSSSAELTDFYIYFAYKLLINYTDTLSDDIKFDTP